MLQAMQDPKRAISDYLSSLNGVNSIKIGKHDTLIGVHGNTDRVESNFGVADHHMHVFRSIAPEHTSGMVVEQRSKHLALTEDHVKHRKSKKATDNDGIARSRISPFSPFSTLVFLPPFSPSLSLSLCI